VLLCVVARADAFAVKPDDHYEHPLDETQLAAPRSEGGKRKISELKAKYASSFDASTTKWVTITSVNPPTNQVQKLCSISGWNKVIVADKKTPRDWQSAGCFFLSVEDQAALEYKTHSAIPYMRYERKMLGYLFAIEMGAQVILDTDDDNIPAAAAPFVLDTDANGDVCADVVNRTRIAWNAYRHFGVHHLHNRGLPLRHIRPGQPLEYEEPQFVRPLIQQGVVHCDPDLDAIQRLTMSPSYTSDVTFSQESTYLAFPPTSFHPINSQNTVFLRDAFWALLMPVTTLWREDDIFRGYWAQRLLWEIGGSLVMPGPTAYQLRNPHDFFLDYNMEHNMYRRTELLLDELSSWECPVAEDIGACIRAVMAHLNSKGFIGRQDVVLSHLWVADLVSLGYEFPKRRFGKEGRPSVACAEAGKLPETFKQAVVRYSKAELQAIFDPVECGTGDERGCIASQA